MLWHICADAQVGRALASCWCDIYQNLMQAQMIFSMRLITILCLYLTLYLPFITTVVCSLICLCTLVAIFDNNMDLDQTASLGS